jgi:hypothetical protein
MARHGDNYWLERLGGASNASTGTVSSIPDQATNITLLAAEPGRVRFTIVNDSPATLYVKFGATASTTSYTYKLFTDDVLVSTYRGQVDGIWASDSTGNARITKET